MLILTHSIKDGPLHIIDSAGEHILIDLLGIKHSQCRYGITAPDNVKIYRDLVWQRIQAEKGINNDDDNGGNR